MLGINLLKHQKKLRLKNEDGIKKIYDPIRKKFLVLQPEELVRQLVLIELMEALKVPRSKISVEQLVKLNGMSKRADILIGTLGGNMDRIDPWMIVECKAPNVKLTDKVFDQIASYNLALRANYLWVSNGQSNWVCQLNYENHSYKILKDWSEVILKTTLQ